jgi:hypothetical protein
MSTLNKELKLRYKNNVTSNEIWIDVINTEYDLVLKLKKLFGEPILYSYEHQTNKELGERVVKQYPNQCIRIYRIIYNTLDGTAFTVEVNGISIAFTYEVQRRNNVYYVVYELNKAINGKKRFEIVLTNVYKTEFIIKALLKELLK